MQGARALKRSIRVESAIARTGRVMQLEGIFDVPPAEKSGVSWEVDLPIEDRDWRIGLMVGPSGCGKSTIARELWPAEYVRNFEWPKGAALVDCFPPEMSIKDITALLNSVGFSSPPSWLRPHAVLSNGEQFRATIARALAELPALCVVDEFTSVVDRRVAQIGSAAIAKSVRRRDSKFIAVSCHYDIEEWLCPDWIYFPAEQRFEWRELRRRPALDLQIGRVPHSAWKIFAHHHYLSGELAPSAVCFCSFLDGRPVTFHSYLPFFGKLKDSRKAVREHRVVTLPDFQGIGIANRVSGFLASMFAGLGRRVFRSTGHPAYIASALNSEDWLMTRPPGRTAVDTGRNAKASIMRARAANRVTASFEFIGDSMPETDADRLHSWST